MMKTINYQIATISYFTLDPMFISKIQNVCQCPYVGKIVIIKQCFYLFKLLKNKVQSIHRHMWKNQYFVDDVYISVPNSYVF